MKRKSLLFLLLLALGLPWAANAQETVEIGTGTTTTYNTPFNSLYNYSFVEQIYLADEITVNDQTVAGTITEVRFYHKPSSTTSDITHSIVLYMKNVTRSTFSGSTDYEAVTESDIVFNGSWTITGSEGWVSITLDTPFEYDGASNLLIAVDENSSGYYTRYFTYTSTTGTVHSYYSDGTNPDPYNLASFSGSGTNNSVNAYRANIQIDITPSGSGPTCPRPTNLTVSNVTSSNASFSWTKGGDETEWVLEYSTAANFTDAVPVPRSGIPAIAINDFAPATTYYARVKAICGGGDESNWSNVVTFTTACDSYDIPYTYGFEEAAPFNCWTVISGNVTVKNSTSNSHASSYYLDFRGTTSNMVALPQFNETTNNLRVEFWTRPESTGGSSGKFAIGYMTDITDASTFVAVETYNSTEMTTTYVKKTVDFANVPANANIAMRQFDCSTNYYWYVDDVTVKAIPSCLAPTGLAANASTTSAVLSWTANSGETAWTIYYKKTTDENYTEVPNATNPYTLSGLTAATNYQYYVVANCSADEASEASEVFPFVTECEAISTYPWTENFDSYTGASSGSTNNLPVCWNYINTCSYSTYKGYPVIYSASGYSHSGNNHLRFYSYYSSYSSYDPQDQYAILPVMENLNGKQLSLFARGANTNSSFKVGLMTDPTDVSTFVEIATTTPTTGYVEYTYNLTGTGNYIAIMIEAANSTATSRTVYIDDITIDLPPACPKPTDLTVVPNSVTAHSVQLSWVSDATAWIVAYKTADDADFTEVNATENPFTLTGLTDGKTYTAKVCAVCNGTPGEWTSNTVSFSTPIACPAPTNLACSGTTGSQTTLNWSGTSDSYDVLYRTAAYAEGIYENFGTSIPSGWEMYTGLLTNGTATLTPSTYVWSFGTGNGVFDNHARVNIYGNNQRWLVTKAFTVLQDASTLSFDIALTAFSGTDVPAPATTGTDDKFIVLISTNNMSSWIPLREWNNSGSEYVYNNIANTATGENVSLDLSAYVGQSVRIAFYGESTTSNADNNLHIDNIHCGIPHEAGEWQTAAEGVTGTTYTLTGLNPETDYEAKVLSNCEGETGHETAVISFTTEAACMVPTELTVVSVTTTTAVLTWTSSSTAWQIQVNEEDPIDVTAIPYTLEGLTPATTYTFKVRANCDGTYTDWSNAMSFATECDAITTFPWNEDFESYSASSSGVKFEAPCWVNEHISGSGSYFFEVYSGTNGTNSTKQLRLHDMSSGTMTKLMLPEMTLPGNDYLFSIDVYRNTSGTSYPGEGIRVYASTDGEIEGATELAFISRNYTVSDGNLIPAESASGWYTYELPIGISGTCYIILRGESQFGSSTYMDNFAVKQIPTCLKPTAFECTATTTTTATFSWTNGAADQTAWQICLNGDEENLIMADSNPFTVEDLTASTAYTAKVRAYCGEEDQSDWSNEVSFATECEPYTITAEAPYTQDFESPVVTTTYSQVGEMPVCWDNYPATYASAKILAADATYNYAESGQVLYFYGSGNNYAALPEFTNDLNTLQISFKYATESDTNGTLTLGYITDEDENYSTFTAIEEYAASSESDDTFIDVDPISLGSLPANATRLVFRWYFSGQWGCNVDDIEVSVIEAPATVTQTLNLVAGWNWVSINVEGEPRDLLYVLEAGLEETEMADIVIKSRDMYTQYYYDDEYDEYYWDGSLESTGLNAGTMYMIYTPVACSVELEGTPANLSEYEFTLTQGWNWVSFPSAEAMDLEDALADFEAEEHDVLKSRFMYTEYYYDDEYDEYYWDGSLTQLTPGDGLMFYSANSNPRPLTWGSSAKAHKANTTVQGLRSKVQMQKPTMPTTQQQRVNFGLKHKSQQPNRLNLYKQQNKHN